MIDAYIHTPLNSLLKLTGGADFRVSESDQEYLSIGFFGPYKTVYSNDSLRQNQTGIYSALNLNTAAGFNAEAGARLNIHSEYGSHFVYNLNPSFLLRNRFKFFANISSGYKTPSLYQLFSEYGNKILKPESALTTEAGIQYYSADKKLSTRITGFSRNVKNIIIFFYDASTFRSQYINQDKQNDFGFEWEGVYSYGKTTLRSLLQFYRREYYHKRPVRQRQHILQSFAQAKIICQY
ncbi:MAG: TonB-dependent receptor [Chitinophagaceae bacterium]|nr:TonB-dependent receptor [Chitinophagaceae bacterium]